MNFIIVGAGAVGCYVGGRLAVAGESVTLIGRPRSIEPLALDGLTVSDQDGFKAHVPTQRLRLATSLANAWPGEATPSDTVILLCVKGGATLVAAAELAATCPTQTTVVSLQNGVDNVSRIASAAPRLEGVAGMVPYNVVMPSATHVHRATGGSLHLARTALTTGMAARMNAAGLTTVLADDMRAVQWGKLLLNLNNPVNALSDLPLREQLLDHDFRKVLAALQTEALMVLGGAGIVPAKVSSAPPRALPYLLRLPNWLFTRAAARMLRIDASARSSMWDDFQHGRATEIDDFCGAVVRMATKHGMQAPYNAAICQLIKAHAKGRRWSGLALRKSLGI